MNAYNAGVISALRAEPIAGDLRAHAGFFRRHGVVVGERPISLHVIEHGLLRGNRPAPWTFWLPMSPDDPRLCWAPSVFDPRVHFALNCGARSCPPIRAYEPERWADQIAIATQSYLSAESEVQGETVWLPALLKLYSRDFPDPLGFVRLHADTTLSASIPASGVSLRWRGYDWSRG